MFIYTLSLASVLGWGWVIKATPRRFTPGERPSVHCIGGRLGRRAGLDGRGKSHPDLDLIPVPSSP